MYCITRSVSLLLMLLLEATCTSSRSVSNSNTLAESGATPGAASEGATRSDSQPPDSPTETGPTIDYMPVKSLNYAGYEIRKLAKKVEMRYGESRGPAGVEYVEVRKNRSLLARFDRCRDPLSTFARFGLFPFLDGDEKQLIVEQTMRRDWCYWIASWSPRFRVLYDSAKYDVDGELAPEDIDKDGIYEFWQRLRTFWFFEHMCGACSPRIGIIFKYDKSARQYFPASHLFPSYLLGNIEKGAAEVRELNRTIDPAKPDAGGQYLSHILNVVVYYIYAGKASEAWSFYDAEYRLKDKPEMRRKIKAQLARCPVYRYIYHRG